MPTVTNTLGEGTQSVLLTVAILECMASERRPISVGELAKRIGTSKSRIFRHLRTLVTCDYMVQHGAGGSYGIGPRLLKLCQATSGQQDLGAIAKPFMEQLSERFRHSVIVSRIEEDGIRVIKSFSGHASIVLEVRPGTILDFDRSAQGRVALAFMDEQAPVGRMPVLATARAKIAKAHPGELQAIRQRGSAIAQMREGLLGAAAPIFGADGRIIGTLALLNTVAEMQQRPAEDALRRAALAMSHLLGYQPSSGE